MNESQSWLFVVDVDVVDDEADVEDAEDEVVEDDDAEEDDDVDVVDVVVVVDDVEPAIIASAIPAPALPLFIHAIVAEDNVDETTSYSAPITWGLLA
jgi:hypothetical protein